MKQAKSLIRVAVNTIEFDDCVIDAKNFQSISRRCLDKGKKELKAVYLICRALEVYFDFKFVPLDTENYESTWDSYLNGFENNETDMTLELWTLSYARQQKVKFSSPIFHYNYAMLTSAKLFETHSTPLRLQAFDTTSSVLILASFIAFILLDAICLMMFARNKKSPSLATGVNHFLDFSGIANPALNQRLIYWPAASAFIWGISLIVRSAYSSYMTSDLVHTTKAPFENFNQMKAMLLDKTLSLTDYPDNDFVHQTNLTWLTDVIRWLDTELGDACQEIEHNNDLIYPAKTDRLSEKIKGNCGKFRPIILRDLFVRGKGVMFKRSMDWRIINLFDREISRLRTKLEQIATSGAMLSCVEIPKENYSSLINLSQYTSVIQLFAVVSAMQCFVFIAELVGWKINLW